MGDTSNGSITTLTRLSGGHVTPSQTVSRVLCHFPSCCVCLYHLTHHVLLCFWCLDFCFWSAKESQSLPAQRMVVGGQLSGDARWLRLQHWNQESVHGSLIRSMGRQRRPGETSRGQALPAHCYCSCVTAVFEKNLHVTAEVS